jgi:outer membrane protein assembly factor BamB
MAPRALLALALLGPWVAAATARAQSAPDDAYVVRYGIPLVDEVHLDAYADFRDYLSAADWSHAFRSIAEQLEDPPPGMVPSEDGLALVWRERIARDLLELERDGWSAFRLYFDAQAQRLLDEAQDDDARRRAAQRVVDSYFPTRSGDDAALMLAQLALAEGRPAEAARHLRSILEYHADTNLERAALWLSYARAAAAAGDLARFEDCRSVLTLRYGGRTLDVPWQRGHAPVDVDAELARLAALVSERADADPFHDTFDAERLSLDAAGTLLWRKTLASYKSEPVGWGNTGGEERYAVPGSVTIGDLLVLNAFGRMLAVRPVTGELAWEAGDVPAKLSTPPKAGARVFFGGLGGGLELAGRFSLHRAGGRLIAVGDVRPAAGRPLLNLVCVEPADGTFVWTTADREEWEDVSVVGHPGIGGDVVYAVVQRVGNYDLALRALALADGRVLWERSLGSPATSSGGGFHMVGPETLPTSPVLHVDGRHVYVMTDAGALFAVDGEAGRIEWAFTYDMHGRPAGLSPGSLVVAGGEVLVFRSRGSRVVHALDPRTRTLRWTHKLSPFSAQSRVVGCDGRHVFLLGDGITCLDAKTGARQWTRPLAVRAGTRRVLFGREHVYVNTTRGLFELRKEDGFNATIVRAELTDLGGGDLLVAGGVLCYLGDVEIGAAGLAP